MAVTRSRVASLLEWLIAAAVSIVALGAGAIVVSEVRSMRAVTPVIAEEAVPAEVPDGIPGQTISLPVLLLADGKAVRVGDRSSEIASQIGDAALPGPDLVERAGTRQRITRFYNYVGSRFALVLERSQADTEARVTAIYLQ